MCSLNQLVTNGNRMIYDEFDTNWGYGDVMRKFRNYRKPFIECINMTRQQLFN